MSCKLPYCKECYGVYKILPIVILLIIMYFFVLKIVFGIDNIPGNDFMNRMAFDLKITETLFGEKCCSMWPISHFILYFILGLLFPECDVLVLGLGILWEVFEGVFGTFENKLRNSGSEKVKHVEYSNSWWLGSYKDILFNFAGFYTAKFLLHVTGKRKICVKKLNNC